MVASSVRAPHTAGLGIVPAPDVEPPGASRVPWSQTANRRARATRGIACRENWLPKAPEPRHDIRILSTQMVCLWTSALIDHSDVLERSRRIVQQARISQVERVFHKWTRTVPTRVAGAVTWALDIRRPTRGPGLPDVRRDCCVSLVVLGTAGGVYLGLPRSLRLGAVSKAYVGLRSLLRLAG